MPAFHVELQVRTLTGHAFNHSQLFVKWKTPKHGKHSGFTKLATVVGHRCQWDDSFAFDIALKPDKKTHVLQPCVVRFSVRQGSVSEFERVGVAEFDIAALASVKFSNQRVLLHKTKANITLQFRVAMRLTSGSPTFRCPTLPNGLLASAEAQESSSNTSSARNAGPAPVAVASLDELLSQAAAAAAPAPIASTFDGDMGRQLAGASRGDGSNGSGRCCSSSGSRGGGGGRCCSSSPRERADRSSPLASAEDRNRGGGGGGDDDGAGSSVRGGVDPPVAVEAQVQATRVPAGAVVDDILGGIFGTSAGGSRT
jgi:hypothetical protein